MRALNLCRLKLTFPRFDSQAAGWDRPTEPGSHAFELAPYGREPRFMAVLLDKYDCGEQQLEQLTPCSPRSGRLSALLAEYNPADATKAARHTSLHHQ